MSTPFLKPINVWTGKELEDYDYEFTWFDDMPRGWRLAFGDEMLKELKAELIRFNYLDDYEIAQIKEKFGTLRWYDNGSPIGKIKLLKEFTVITEEDSEYLRSLDRDEYYYSLKERKENYTIYNIYKILDKCKVNDIIYKYENLSEDYCYICGKPSRYITKGWIEFVCEEHAKVHGMDGVVPKGKPNET